MALTTRYDREDLQHRVFDICIAIPVRHHSVTQEYFLAIEVLSLTSIVTDQPGSEEAADGSLRSPDLTAAAAYAAMPAAGKLVLTRASCGL
jgi:hypothetical protein